MGYLNPIEINGYDKFISLCQDGVIDGVLMVDLPLQEAGDFYPKLAKLEDKRNRVFALTNFARTLQQVLKHGGGFIYYVSVKGVTGSKALDAQDVGEHVQAIKAITKLCLCALVLVFVMVHRRKAAGQYADGVIVGSELVKKLCGCGQR